MAGARAGERSSDIKSYGELAPACSGALALRRITALLSSARRADAQGEFSQARDLYMEVVKVQRTLSRAPLGSIGKSLREVVVGVEARLQQLQPDGSDSTPCKRIPSSSSKSSAVKALGVGGGPTAAGQRQDDGGGSKSSRPPGLPGGELPSSQVSWDLLDLSDCPPSARDGYGGRPTTRDGHTVDGTKQPAGRPTTRDGCREGGIRPCTDNNGRPATSDCWRQLGLDGSRLLASSGPGGASGLDGTRPATREDIRLQHQLDGTRPSARDRKNGSREATETTPRRPSRESRHASSDALVLRPSTRDSVRPGTRDLKDRRCQDVTILQVVTGGRRRRSNQQACEAQVVNLETSPVGCPSPDVVPFSPELDAFGDDSGELLE